LVSGACATAPPIGVAPLLNESRQNEIAAYAKNRDHNLSVVGVVLQTGMDAYSRVVAEGYGFGWAVSVSAHQELEHYPYVFLGDDRTPSPDMLKCLFSTDDANTVGGIRPGMMIRLRGRFHQYVHEPGRIVMVLSDCSLQ